MESAGEVHNLGSRWPNRALLLFLCVEWGSPPSYFSRIEFMMMAGLVLCFQLSIMEWSLKLSFIASFFKHVGGRLFLTKWAWFTDKEKREKN